MDNFDKLVYDAIQKRRENGSSYTNTFNSLYNIGLSETEARKELRGIENHLSFKMDISEENEDMPDYKESMELLSDGGYKSDKLLRMSREESKDPAFLLKAHGFDSKYWEISNARNNIWNVYSKQDGVQQLYSSKITVKPFIPEFTEDWIREVVNGIDFKKLKLKTNRNFLKEGKVIEVNLCDVHIGKFVKELVSNGVYDTDIAVKRYMDAIDDAINKMTIFNIKEIVYIVGQDYLNIDTIEGTTKKGTRQDMNDFYEAIYKKALDCLIKSAEKLRAIAPLRIVYVKGNHDKQSTFSMVCTLEHMYTYSGVEDVIVDSGMKQRKYLSFGDVLIGYGHGEEEKTRIFDCMQADVPELWHKKRKYFHLSHKHRESKMEKAGVIYQWLGSLSENCNWTWSSGFVGSEKKGHVFVYDEEKGLEFEIFIKA